MSDGRWCRRRGRCGFGRTSIVQWQAVRAPSVSTEVPLVRETRLATGAETTAGTEFGLDDVPVLFAETHETKHQQLRTSAGGLNRLARNNPWLTTCAVTPKEWTRWDLHPDPPASDVAELTSVDTKSSPNSQDRSPGARRLSDGEVSCSRRASASRSDTTTGRCQTTHGHAHTIGTTWAPPFDYERGATCRVRVP
jgi:hypothetical protein